MCRPKFHNYVSVLRIHYNTDGSPPVIHDTKLIGTKQLQVTWSSDNTDIIETEVIWENVNLNISKSTVVEWYRREVIIDIVDCTYNITVVERNKCQKSFPSDAMLVNVCKEQLFPSISPTSKYTFCADISLFRNFQQCFSFFPLQKSLKPHCYQVIT